MAEEESVEIVEEREEFLEDREELELSEDVIVDSEEEEMEMLEQEASFPPYWFKSRKQKRKFFNNLNQQFLSKLQHHKIAKGMSNESEKSHSAIQKPRLTIHTGKTVVRRFDKFQQVDKMIANDF